MGSEFIAAGATSFRFSFKRWVAVVLQLFAPGKSSYHRNFQSMLTVFVVWVCWLTNCCLSTLIGQSNSSSKLRFPSVIPPVNKMNSMIYSVVKHNSKFYSHLGCISESPSSQSSSQRLIGSKLKHQGFRNRGFYFESFKNFFKQL